MNPSILIVDDEPVTRYLLRLILESVGFKVLEAECGLDALQKARQNRPDVMIFEVMKEQMAGFALYKSLFQEEETADFAIMTLSAKTQVNAMSTLLRAGVTKYLPKPVSAGDLIENIDQVLNNS